MLRVARALCAGFSLAATNVCAQNMDIAGTAHNRQFGLAFGTVFPVGELGRNLATTGYGVNLELLVPIGSSPVLVGGDFSAIRYGHVSRDTALSETIPGVTVAVNSSSIMLMPHLLVRIQPATGRIRPYVDGLVGFQNFRSYTCVDLGRDSPCSTNLSDSTSSYGLGGGLDVQLHRSGRSVFLLDGKVRYERGGPASYAKPMLDRGQSVFSVFTSRTDAVFVHVGMAVRF